MPYVSEIVLSLNVLSRILSPDEITAIAGILPTEFHHKGEPRNARHPIPREANFWSLTVEIRGFDSVNERTDWFSDGIVRLLERVPKDFVHQLDTHDPDVSATIWAGLFDVRDQGAFNIRADASRMLGEYGLELVFDMYIHHSEL